MSATGTAAPILWLLNDMRAPLGRTWVRLSFSSSLADAQPRRNAWRTRRSQGHGRFARDAAVLSNGPETHGNRHSLGDRRGEESRLRAPANLATLPPAGRHETQKPRLVRP